MSVVTQTPPVSKVYRKRLLLSFPYLFLFLSLFLLPFSFSFAPEIRRTLKRPLKSPFNSLKPISSYFNEVLPFSFPSFSPLKGGEKEGKENGRASKENEFASYLTLNSFELQMEPFLICSSCFCLWNSSSSLRKTTELKSPSTWKDQTLPKMFV